MKTDDARYPRWVLLVALAGMFATTFPITVLTLAIPTIAEGFDVDEAALAWLITLPVLASALALPVLGKLGDLYGHRKVFIAGFVIATVTTALTATATGPLALIGWRTLTQVAGASTMPSSLALINSVHHGKGRARAMGWWSMTAAGAPVVGLTIGAPVIDAVGWQMLFLVQAVLMAGAVVASWLVLQETPRRFARFDAVGAVLLALGVGPLLLAVNQVPEWGLTSPATIVCLVVAVAGIAAFAIVEPRVPAPLVPLEFFRTRVTVAALVTSFLCGAAYMGAFFLASLLVVKQFGYSLTSAVPLLTIRPLLFAAASPLGGWLTGRASSRMASVAGHVILACGLVGLAVGAAVDSLPVVLTVGFLLQGIGFGLLRPAISTALADAVDERDLGVAGAAERLTGQVGVAFGITILATVYGSDVDRFPAAFLVGAVFAAVGAVVSVGLPRHRARFGDVDLELPPDDDPRRQAVRAWLAEHPQPTGAQLAEAGYVAPHWPAPWGLSADPIHQLIIDDELRRAQVRRPINPIGIGWAGPTILHAGSDEQKERYLFPLLAGEEMWCQLFSEPGAGSDLAGLATRAVRDGDEWVVTGQKIWTSLAHFSKYGILIARTDPDLPKHRGVSYFVCPMDAPGITIRPIIEMTGGHTFNEVFLDEVRIPAENLVGNEGQGWDLAKVTLANERVSLSSGGAIWGQGPTVDDLVDVVRKQGGVQDPMLRERLVDLHIEGELLRLNRLRVVSARVQGKQPGHEASIGKAMSDEHGQKLFNLAKDLAGAGAMLTDVGPLGDDPALWHHGFLFSPALTVGGGTSEVQRNIIAERALGLPHEPDVETGLTWSESRRAS